MKTENIFDKVSRSLAGKLYPSTSRGRTLSKMTADRLGTNTTTVHLVGAIAIVAIWISLKNNR